MKDSISNKIRLETLDSGEAVLSVSLEDTQIPSYLISFYKSQPEKLDEIRISMRTYLGSIFLYIMEQVADWHARESVALQCLRDRVYDRKMVRQRLEARIKEEKETILELHSDVGRYTIGPLTLLENAKRNELHIVGDKMLVEKLYFQMQSKKLLTCLGDHVASLNMYAKDEDLIDGVDIDFSMLYESGSSYVGQSGSHNFQLSVPSNRINADYLEASEPLITPLMEQFIQISVPKEKRSVAVTEFKEIVVAYRKQRAILKSEIANRRKVLLDTKSCIDTKKTAYNARSTIPILSAFINRYRKWRLQKLDQKLKQYRERVKIMNQLCDGVDKDDVEAIGMILDCPHTKELFENHRFSCSPFKEACLTVKARLKELENLNPNHLFGAGDPKSGRIVLNMAHPFSVRAH